MTIEAKFRDGESVALMGGGRASAAADMSGLVEADRQMALPAILGPEQHRPSRDVLFSIRPAHAEKILTGDKTVELRRRFASAITPGTLALIYSTSPTSALTHASTQLEPGWKPFGRMERSGETTFARAAAMYQHDGPSEASRHLNVDP